MKLQKDTTLTGFLESSDGIPKAAFRAEVSPCCYMYAGYGVQLRVELDCGGWTTVNDKSVQFSDCTIEQAQTLAETVKVRKCSCCDNPAIDPGVTETNRAGQCEKCFLAKLRRELEADQKKEEAKLRKKDGKMKLKGYTHRVEAWVHPEHGDDYQLSIWAIDPSAEDIQKILRKRGCSIGTDYQLIQL